jgi:hypothetical protein
VLRMSMAPLRCGLLPVWLNPAPCVVPFLFHENHAGARVEGSDGRVLLRITGSQCAKVLLRSDLTDR